MGYSVVIPEEIIKIIDKNLRIIPKLISKKSTIQSRFL